MKDSVAYCSECKVRKDGPYIGARINELIAQGEKALAGRGEGEY